jgi:hypothetical protein
VRTENRLNVRNDIFHDEREMLGWRAKKMGVYKTNRERGICAYRAKPWRFCCLLPSFPFCRFLVDEPLRTARLPRRQAFLLVIRNAISR